MKKRGGNPFSHTGTEALMSIHPAGFKGLSMNIYSESGVYVREERTVSGEEVIRGFSRQNNGHFSQF